MTHSTSLHLTISRRFTSSQDTCFNKIVSLTIADTYTYTYTCSRQTCKYRIVTQKTVRIPRHYPPCHPIPLRRTRTT